MQITCRCKYCGHRHYNEDELQPTLEFDFSEEEIIFFCRNKGCKRKNTINFADKRKTQPLPTTRVMHGV